ncbi:glycosyltransferase [Desulfovibrio sp. JC010]|uniref:glycosyltransferase n=1 Tax=Desulfovibrio sp. JC010 TaxID=2593641 RepID=UPI0013D59DD0|nr:glycosyltransferase [Desulfovibrio sp. JC010]NDV27495.1 glycosyltransferase [Desulfovibrio sp. JC010]
MAESAMKIPVVWVLLPAFNEEKSFATLFSQLDDVFKELKQEYRIVVVNDGSTDDSAPLLERLSGEYPLEVLTHVINRGLGETERDGFEFIAQKSGAEDVIVRLDCDVTHDPMFIKALLDKMAEGYDAVNTSRFQPGGGQTGVSGYRAFISYMANLFMRVIFNLPQVKDYSCGFRAYRASIIKDAIGIFGNGFIQLKGLGFTSTLEMIVKLKLLGCRFAEVPFVLRYDLKPSESKMITSLTTLGYLVMAFIYHWPFGGWRSYYKKLAPTYKKSREQAFSRYAVPSDRPAICRIGG